MACERIEVSITANGSGDGTGFANPTIAGGYLQAIRYVPDGSLPYATGVDFTITGETSGIAILTVTNAGTAALDFFPRAATQTIANAAALYAAGGTAVNDRIPVGERVKIVVAQAGANNVGKFHVFVTS